MKSLREKKFSTLVLVILCITMLGIIVVPNVSFKKKTKEVVAKSSNYRSQVITTNTGTWNFSMLFKSADNITLNGLDNAVITSNSDVMEENEITVTNNIALVQGTSGSDVFMGDITYKIDLSELFLDGFTWENNYDDNALEIRNTSGDTVAKLYMGDIVSDDYMLENDSYLDEGAVPFAWYYMDDEGFNVYNYESFGSNDDYTRSFDIRIVLDYATYKNATIHLTSSLIFNSDSIDSSEDSNVQFAFYKEQVNPFTMTSVVKNDGDVHKKWENSWGTNPANDEYYYILYNVSYNLAIEDGYSVSNIPHITNGELVAYGDQTDLIRGTMDNYINSDYAEASAGNNSRVYIVKYANPAVEGETSNTFGLEVTVPGEYSENISWSTVFDYHVEAKYPTTNSNDLDIEISDDNYGLGAINRLKSDTSVTFKYLIESAADSINNGYDGTLYKGFNNWYSSNYGENDVTSYLKVSDLYISNTYGTGGNEVELQNGDYKIKSIKLLDDKEYDYKLDENANAYYLDLAEISNYTNKNVYVKTGSDWTLVGTYKKNSSGTVDYTVVGGLSSYSDNVVTLPDNVSEVKVEYTGKRAAVYVGYEVEIELLPTSNVKGIIQNTNNYLDVTADSLVTKERNYHNLSELSTESEMTVTSTNNGLTNDVNSITYTISVKNSINYQPGQSDLARALLNSENGGELDILLPAGATVPNGVSISAYGGVSVVSTGGNTDLYGGTNRTLVKVIVSNEDNYLDQNNKITTGYQFDLNVNYTQIANRDFGNVLKLDAMYVSNNVINGAYKLATDASDELFSDPSVKTLFNGINSENKYNKLFNTDTLRINPVTVVSGQAETYVKAYNDTDYALEASVREGYKYSYKLEYSYSDPLLRFNNFVFYDVLEEAYGGNEYVKGTFDSVDTTYLEETLNVRPEIYYSVKDNINLTTDTDLNDESIWSKDLPSDKSRVKAVAIDLGSKVFDGQNHDIPVAYINMTASTNYTKEGVYAYNNALVKYTDLFDDDVKSSTSPTAKVLLNKALVELGVVSKQDITGEALPNGGSSEQPSTIERNYGYLYTINNKDTDYSYDNVNVNSILSDGIEVDASNIKYYYGDVNSSKLITEDDVVSYEFVAASNSFNLSVSSLDAEEIINIWVPVNVQADTITSEQAVISNASMINRLGGKGYRGDTINVYNSILIPQIQAAKFIKNDNVFITTDTDELKVKKGSTYTYMIKVENVSDVVANATNVVDNIPAGLIVNVNSISNGGTYNSDEGKITWNLTSIGARDSVELTYDVTIPNGIPNNTSYSSKGHVKVTNPFNNDYYIFDEDTNAISIIYTTAADIIVNSSVTGTLLHEEKEFTYIVIAHGHDYDAGSYDVMGNDGTKIGSLVIDNTGNGSYNFMLTSGKKATVKNLPAGLAFEVKQMKEAGYETTESEIVLVEGNDSYSLDGVTSDGKTISYTFINDYSATGQIVINGKVEYAKDHAADDFEFELNSDPAGYSDVKTNNANDVIEFLPITYTNEVGSYAYTIKQHDMGNDRIEYDDNYFKVFVTVTDKGNGQLQTSAKYFDKYDNEVNEVKFVNKFIEVGLLIKNTYSGDYIREDKVFNFTVEVDADTDGNYEVVDQDGHALEPFVVENGHGSYERTLGSSESFLIKELPVGSTYTAKLQKEANYTSTVDGGVDSGEYVTTNGTIDISTKKVIFDSVYSTVANFKPEVTVEYDNELQDGEFIFRLKDVSEMSNGYSDLESNNVDGVINFRNITFTKPGTYKYQITQVKGASNHIYYDEGVILLTLVLSDNANGTMSIDYSYTYPNNSDGFVNRYSEEPIIQYANNNGSNTNNNYENLDGYHGIGNPNTLDYIIWTIVTLLIGVTGFVVSRIVKIKKYSN